MKKQRLLLGALIFSVSGWASASVPIIKLPQSQRVEVNFYSLLALNNTLFAIRDNSKLVEINAGNGMRDLQSGPVPPLAFGIFSGILKQVGNMSTLIDHQVSEGSFSSYARGTSSSYVKSVTDVGPSSTELRYGPMITSPPALKNWAVLLLAVGCVIHLGRRRQRPFGYRKLN